MCGWHFFSTNHIPEAWLWPCPGETWRGRRNRLLHLHWPSSPRAEGERPRAWVPPLFTNTGVRRSRQAERHVCVRATPRVTHPLGSVIAFYEALTCGDYIKKKKKQSWLYPQFKGSLWSSGACVAGQSSIGKITIHIEACCRERKEASFALCLYICWGCLPSLWHPQRGVTVYRWTHRSNQSPLTVRKSMFNFPSHLCPQPHRKKQLFYFPSFTTVTLKTQHVQMFDRSLHLYINVYLSFFILHRTWSSFLIIQAFFFLFASLMLKKKCIYIYICQNHSNSQI